MRMRHGAPEVSCSPMRKPSRSHRYKVAVDTPSSCPARAMVTTSAFPAGCDISGCRLASGDVVVGAELADVGFGPGQPGGGAPALLPEDLGDGGVVVVRGEPRTRSRVSSLVTRLCCPVLASGTVSSVLAPPCQMIRRPAVASRCRRPG